jgi:hypothetical protein
MVTLVYVLVVFAIVRQCHMVNMIGSVHVISGKDRSLADVSPNLILMSNIFDGADCGPSNALSSVVKHVEVDRSLQRVGEVDRVTYETSADRSIG